MSSSHLNTDDYESHLRCLESLIDQDIDDVEQANDELDDLKDMAQVLGCCVDKAGEHTDLLELLQQLITLKEEKLQAQDALYVSDE
ncbi:MAG: hypothetical protein Q9209_001670 [Squamulea sp. 1 TL-2023]